MIYLVDTNFLIYCWRNANQPERLRHLQPYLASEVQLVWIVKAEFLRGAVVAQHDPTRVNEFLGRHKTLWPDEETVNLYAQLYMQLYRGNLQIGPHDLWIATIALQYKLPLITRNVNEFQRVPGLDVLPYVAS